MINLNVNQSNFLNKCFDCHVYNNNLKHPSKSDVKDFNLIKEEKDLCLSCHNKEIKVKRRNISNIKSKLNSKFVHNPVENSCIGCHNPHSSNFPHLLKDSFPAGSYGNNFALCFACHDENLLKEQFTPKNTNFRNGDTNLHFVHSNQEKGRSCILCHDVHGSDNEKLIKEHSKFGNWKFELSFIPNPNGGECSPACHKTKQYNVKLNDKPLASSNSKMIEKKEVINSIPSPEITKQELSPSINESDEVFVDEIEISSNRQKNKSETKILSFKNEKPALKKKVVTIKKNKAKLFNLTPPKNTSDTVLNSSVKSYLKSLAKYLKKYPKLKLKIEVIINKDIPNYQIQVELQKYSKPVINFMIKNGISSNRIEQIAILSNLKNKKQKSISLKVTN